MTRSTGRRAAPPFDGVGARTLSDIGYYLLRIRAEIGHMRVSAKREVAMVHFQLASRYLQHIHALLDEAGGLPLKEGRGARSRATGGQAAADRSG